MTEIEKREGRCIFGQKKVQERQAINESKGLKSVFAVMGVYPGW